MWFWMLWWSFDDHLAVAMGMPGLGQLPIWVPLLIGIALSLQSTNTTTKEVSVR